MGYWCVLMFVPIGSIFILNALFSMCKNRSDSILALSSSGVLLCVNFLIFHIYETLSDRLEIRKQQIIFNKQMELCKTQIIEREESDLNIRNIKHDIKNHLLCIREYMEKEHLDYAKKYIDGLIFDDHYFKNNSSIDSGNIVVDALLNYKLGIMKGLGIELIYRLEIPYDFSFNDVDICIILGNCLDNSIEAVSKLDTSDIEKKIIYLEFIYRKKNLLLKIRNPYIGNTKLDKQGNYITTKENPENHGIGLISVKKAVMKYDGMVHIMTENQMFIVEILLYSKGILHINS